MYEPSGRDSHVGEGLQIDRRRSVAASWRRRRTVLASARAPSPPLEHKLDQDLDWQETSALRFYRRPSTPVLPVPGSRKADVGVADKGLGKGPGRALRSEEPAITSTRAEHRSARSVAGDRWGKAQRWNIAAQERHFPFPSRRRLRETQMSWWGKEPPQLWEFILYASPRGSSQRGKASSGLKSGDFGRGPNFDLRSGVRQLGLNRASCANRMWASLCYVCGSTAPSAHLNLISTSAGLDTVPECNSRTCVAVHPRHHRLGRTLFVPEKDPFETSEPQVLGRG